MPTHSRLYHRRHVLQRGCSVLFHPSRGVQGVRGCKMPCCATAQVCRRCLPGSALAHRRGMCLRRRRLGQAGCRFGVLAGQLQCLLTCCAKPNAHTARSATWATAASSAGWNLSAVFYPQCSPQCSIRSILYSIRISASGRPVLTAENW